MEDALKIPLPLGEDEQEPADSDFDVNNLHVPSSLSLLSSIKLKETDVSRRILELLLHFRRTPQCIATDSKGKRDTTLRLDDDLELISAEVDVDSEPLQLARICEFVDANAPIIMTMPSFPSKSVNTRDKVLGVVPDQAERLCLAFLRDVCRFIRRELYTPGAHIVIASDGRVFGNIDCVDEDILAYSKGLQKMLHEIDATRELSWFSLEDFPWTSLLTDSERLRVREADESPNSEVGVRAELHQFPEGHLTRLRAVKVVCDQGIPLHTALVQHTNDEATDALCAEGDKLRHRLLHVFGGQPDDVKALAAKDVDVEALFNGLHRFMRIDLVPAYPTIKQMSDEEQNSGVLSQPAISLNKHKKITSKAAWQILRRSRAWGELLRRALPHAVRLSIHPQRPGNPAAKLGMHMMSSRDAWLTPWHGVAVRTPTGQWRLSRRQIVRELVQERPDLAMRLERHPVTQEPDHIALVYVIDA
ncbi:MAG: hypothetical protein MHM6MM_002864 [Cercozoa sp. M6MM]